MISLYVREKYINYLCIKIITENWSVPVIDFSSVKKCKTCIQKIKLMRKTILNVKCMKSQEVC